MFIPATKDLTIKYPVVLFFDGHHSHLSLKLIKMARENRIHLICFPPHCTHIMQPLDVSVFGPIKDAWRKLLKEFQLKTCAATLTKEDFPSLICKLWEVSFLPSHLKSGFLKCGLCPFNRAAIPSDKLTTAQPHRKPPATQPEMASDSNEVILRLSGEVVIKSSITHIRLHLRGYFSDLLQKNKWTGKERRVNRN